MKAQQEEREEGMAGNHYDIIIVGTGPSGLTAAIYGQRLGMMVVAFGDIPGGNLYMIERLMNFPGFVGGVPGAQFGATVFAQAQAEGVTFPMTRLERLIHQDNAFVAVDVNGERYEGRSAVVACGVVPRMLKVPNADKPGIYFCSLCDGPLFRNKNATIVVIGGGNMAGQEALSLSNIAERVLLVYHGHKLKMEAVMQKAIEKKPNIEVLLGTTVVAFKGEERVDGVVVSTEKEGQKEIHAEGVFMAVGWGPNLEMLNIAVEKTEEGYIKTNQKLMSSFPGLFAAGDVRDTDIRQVITACADGARAATYALEYLDAMKD
jgi:thioredoxin reductase (NADPH)